MPYDNSNVNPSVPSYPGRAIVVTPGPTLFDPSVVYAGGSGTVTVEPELMPGTTVTFTVQAGGVIPLRVTKVTAATATGLVRVY